MKKISPHKARRKSIGSMTRSIPMDIILILKTRGKILTSRQTLLSQPFRARIHTVNLTLIHIIVTFLVFINNLNLNPLRILILTRHGSSM